MIVSPYMRKRLCYLFNLINILGGFIFKEHKNNLILKNRPHLLQMWPYNNTCPVSPWVMFSSTSFSTAGEVSVELKGIHVFTSHSLFSTHAVFKRTHPAPGMKLYSLTCSPASHHAVHTVYGKRQLLRPFPLSTPQSIENDSPQVSKDRIIPEVCPVGDFMFQMNPDS